MMLERYGFCSKTGRCLNPFGARPLWVIRRAFLIRQRLLLETLEAAPF
jgi:hypothetical protein